MSAPFTVPFGSSVYVGAPNQDYIDGLRKRKEVITRLCATLHEYLSLDVETALEFATNPPKMPRRPKPTIEDLDRAQKELDAAQSSWEAIETLADKMPPGYGDAFIDAQRPAFQRLVKPLEDQISWIQQTMEEPEPDPSDPWDGRDVGTLCAVCAKPSEQHARSVKAVGPLLHDAGWRRDADGDHVCPACFAASTNLNPTPAAPADPSTATESGSQQKEEGAK